MLLSMYRVSDDNESLRPRSISSMQFLRLQIPGSSRAGRPVELMIITLVLVVAMVSRTEIVSQAVRNAALGLSLGVAAMYLIVGFLQMGAFPKILMKFVVFATLLVAIYAVSVSYSPKASDALVTVLQLILVFSWVLFVSLVPWTLTVMKTVYGLITIFVLSNLSFLIADYTVHFGGFLTSKNILGPMLFSSAFFVVHTNITDNRPFFRKPSAVLLLIILVLISATASRSSQICLAFSLIVYAMWPIITRHKMMQILTFITFVTATVGVIFFYLALPQLGMFDFLQDIFQKYTYGPVHSGREFVWPIIIDHISQRPLLGWGAGFREEDIVYRPEQGALSTHNLYLAVALQTGIIGTILLFGLLYAIWSIFCVLRTDQTVRLSGSFFLGICMHQWFNLSLIQNNVSVAVLFWTIIGIGINRVIVATRLASVHHIRRVSSFI